MSQRVRDPNALSRLQVDDNVCQRVLIPKFARGGYGSFCDSEKSGVPCHDVMVDELAQKVGTETGL